jgi:O-antigen ligase
VKLNIAKITNWLFGLLLIVAPSNLFLVLCDSCGYVQGLRSDYLIPRLYASDVLLIAILLLNWKALLSLIKSGSARAKKFSLVLLLIIGFVIRQFLSLHVSAALWNFIQILMLGGVGWLLLTKQLVSKKTWIVGLSVALLLQTSLGWYQFVQQKPLLPYYFLGETNIRRKIGIPQAMYPFAQLGERAIPHGTTAHPNVLAGFIALYSILLITFLLRKKDSPQLKIFVSITIALSWSVFFLTQSFSGAALLVSGGLVLISYTYLKKIRWLSVALVVGIFISGLLLSYIHNDSTSITRRQYLLDSSFAYIKSSIPHAIWGTGISNFTSSSEEFSSSKEVVRFNQPVHNVGWLFLAENGLSGLIIIGILIAYKGRNTTFTATLALLFPILIWDHYLLSIQPGRELFLITFMGLLLESQPELAPE